MSDSSWEVWGCVLDKYFFCACVILHLKYCICAYSIHAYTNLAYVMLSHFSRVQLFATLWTVACQAPLSVGFGRQEYGRGLPCPPPGDLPNPGIETVSLMSPALVGGFFTTSATWEAQVNFTCCLIASCLSNHMYINFILL